MFFFSFSVSGRVWDFPLFVIFVPAMFSRHAFCAPPPARAPSRHVCSKSYLPFGLELGVACLAQVELPRVHDRRRVY